MTTHGLRGHPLYGVWWDMKNRCYRPNREKYRIYGARGIRVCNEWKDDFQVFYDWAMSHGYKEGLTLDRIDVNGNYEPSNCRWATPKEQANNRRGNLNITYDNRTQTLKQWSEELGIKYLTLYMRVVRYGWSISRAFNTPIKK